MSRMQPESNWSIRALIVILAVALPTAWLAYQHAGLQVDAENQALKSEDTPEARDLRHVEAVFGFGPRSLDRIHGCPGLELGPAEHKEVARIAAELHELEGVERVEGPLPTDRGMDCLSVILSAGGDGFAAAADRITQALPSLVPPTLEAHATGQPLGELAIARALDGERRATVPLVAGTLLLLLLVLYRSIRIALLVMLPAGVGIAWAGGLFAWLGHDINPIAVLLEPVVLTVGVAVSIHFVEAFVRERRLHGPRIAAARVRAELWLPTLLTTLTTMIGFLSLLVHPIPALRSFGMYAALGVAIASAVGVLLLPWLCAVFAPAQVHQLQLQMPVQGYTAWLARHRGSILFALAIVSVLLLQQWTHATIDNDPLRVLPHDSEFRQTTDEMVARLGGVEQFGILVPRESIETPSTTTQQDGAPRSATRGATRARDDRDQRLAVLVAELKQRPEIVRFLRQPLRSASGEFLLRATLAPSGSTERLALFDAIKDLADQWELPGVRAVGSAVQIARDSDRLIRAQLLGLLLVVPILAAAVAIGLRSWRAGLLSLIPNTLPCVLLYGGVTLLGGDLSVATVMIGSTMMGLIVDDTIHFLHRYEHGRRHGASAELAICDALRIAGRPITITSILLAIGLGMGALGELNSTMEFSLMAAATVAIAWLLDVVVMPALLLRGLRSGQGHAIRSSRLDHAA
jgi:predicted RND superfamily exporter protein